ncbi:hypothetical protein N431DRAFT_443887 [Stipitochalara longipes BDJ]|nr:hypothetical protein N431DRAFT_443887 [Stipitochalara longipes BDJ]
MPLMQQDGWVYDSQLPSIAVGQHRLEAELWAHFWDENDFPGQYPIMIADETEAATIPQSPATSTKIIPQPYGHSASTSKQMAPQSRRNSDLHQKPIPCGPAALNKFSSRQLSDERPTFSGNPTATYVVSEFQKTKAWEAILNHKGKDYAPRYGWDEQGLPNYTILCFIGNGFDLLYGSDRKQFLKPVYDAFPKFFIVYQRVRRGFMILWLEAKARYLAAMLAGSGELWGEFKQCWAFLKSWASQKGAPVDIATYLKRYKGDDRAWADANRLTPPASSIK